MTDNAQLIAWGLKIEEARRKGGKTVYKKYGPAHFSKLGKISAEKKKALKNEAKLGY